MINRLHAILAGALALVLALPLAAHELRPAIADLFLENGTFRLEISLNLEAVMAEIGSEAEDTQDSENADKYDEFRAMAPDALNTAFDRAAFVNKLSVMLDGVAGSATVTEVSVDEIGDLALTRDSHIIVTGPLGTAKTVQLGWDAAYGEIIIRLMDEQNDYNVYLTNGDISDPISTEGGMVISFWTNLVNYTVVGYYHILPLGLDHILFIVGLFLLSTRLKPLLWQVTAFTLAHSITLAMGVLGILVIPGSIVEPLIAASIVYVCIENIFMPHMSRWRVVIIFLFGLLHGQGFAGALTEFGLSTNNIASGLIGFNVGVELGQISVILICFALVGFWFSKKDWYRGVVVIPVSFVIAMIGAYWVLERTGVIAPFLPI